MAKKRIQLVVSDMDGTRSSYWDGAVPAWREQLPKIAEIAEVSVAELGRQMGRVINYYNTHDYPWVLECCDFARDWRGRAREFNEQIVQPYWQAMDSCRQEYVRLYDCVEETDAALAEIGIPIVILSDSPFHVGRLRGIEAEQRRKIKGGRISGFYALALKLPESGHLFDPNALEFGMERVKSLNNAKAPDYWKEVELPWAAEKPDTFGIKWIMQQWNITDPSSILVIGDSFYKDGGLAGNIGARFIHTPSGMVSALPTEYRNLIENVLVDRTVLPPTQPTLKRAVPLISVASDYSEILNHLYVDSAIHEAVFPE